MQAPAALAATIAGVALRSSSRRADLMGMAAPVYYSAEMVRSIPDDGKRYETVRGELLVTPAPRAWHQEIVTRLVVRLRTWLEEHPVGHLLQSPADISWGPDILVQPDLFVVDLEQARTMDWTRMKRLLLVIEVLSRTTARADRFTKRRLYQEIGIPSYWIVDPDQEAVEVWTPDAAFPTIERATLAWRPAGSSDAFQVSVQDLFRPL